jgi:deoxycytidine triphosphate deaminase
MGLLVDRVSLGGTAMSLLSKGDIRKLIEREQTFSRDDQNAVALDHQVQPASFDITVGRIYIPPKSGDESTAEVVERNDFYTLEPGAMVVVLSREHVQINSASGGFVFPKNGDFALKGLLFTNFGHIDPGFTGHLRFTVINMGRKSFSLRHGERIAGVTLFRLTSPTDPYVPQHGSSCETVARVLSRDFLDVETRVAGQARNSVKEEFSTRDRRSIWINGVQMLVLLVVTTATFMFSLQSTVSGIYEKLATATVEIHKLQLQLDALKRTDQPLSGQQK